MAIRAGDLLCGKYLLDATIGRGGMGEVFAATIVADDLMTPHLIQGMKVAVKVVNRSICDDLLMARLYREADAARRIRSEYVPTLLAVETTKDENGKDELFIVMQLLHGQSFSQRLKSRGGYLSWEEVHAMGEGVLLGLMDAHAAGIVHRDLKPGNIFLAQQPDGMAERAMILDFGVCKLDGSDADKLTVTGESLGTVSYMAPEQIRGASKVDERADLYSFAMVVFEALSGRLAHDASGQMAMLASKLERSARNLKEVHQVPIPPTLDAIVAKCLARKPNDRYSSAGELLKVWRGLGKASTQPRAVSAPILPSLQPATQTALTANTIDADDLLTTPGRTGLMAIGGAVAAAIAVVTFLVVGHTTSSANTDSATPSITAAGGSVTDSASAVPMPMPTPTPVLSAAPSASAAPSGSAPLAVPVPVTGAPTATVPDVDDPSASNGATPPVAANPTPVTRPSGGSGRHGSGGSSSGSSSSGSSSSSGKSSTPGKGGHIKDDVPF